ncbi:MAG: hypothetical protein Kow0042_01870 [Calditrichia bacterium]
MTIFNKKPPHKSALKRGLLLSLSLVLWVGLFSCKKISEPILPNQPDTYSPPPPRISQFSLSIGSFWNYSIVDTLYYTYTGKYEVYYDSLTATIVGSTVLPNGKSATILHYQFQDRVDTMYAIVTGDTLLFYQMHSGRLVGSFGFILPLEVNKEWYLMGFDYKVYSSPPLEVPAGLFKHVIDVREYVRMGNAYGWNSYFIAPEVGIVKYKYRIFVTLSEVNHMIQWALLSYSISE